MERFLYLEVIKFVFRLGLCQDQFGMVPKASQSTTSSVSPKVQHIDTTLILATQPQPWMFSSQATQCVSWCLSPHTVACYSNLQKASQ